MIELKGSDMNEINDRRTAAEERYLMTAHAYEKNPIGSPDWTLYWAGWQAAIALNQQGRGEPAAFEIRFGSTQPSSVELTPFLSRATEARKLGLEVHELVRRGTAPQPAEPMSSGQVEWQDAERIADLPEVDELLQGFVEDPTGDAGTMIVRAVMQAVGQPTQPATTPADNFARAQDQVSRWPAWKRDYKITKYSGQASAQPATSAEPYDAEERCRAYYNGDLRPYIADGMPYARWQAVWMAAQFDMSSRPDNSRPRPHPVAARPSVPHGWKLVPDYKPGMIVKYGGEEYKIFALGDKPGTFDICHPTDNHRDRWLSVPPDHLEPLSTPPADGQTQQDDETQRVLPLIRDILTFVLWHHQGGSSKIGQPIRKMLGMGQHDRLTEAQYETARRVQNLMAQRDAGEVDSERLDWLEKHFTDVNGVYKDSRSEVHSFGVDCEDDTLADGDQGRIRSAIDIARAQQGGQ